MDLLIFRSPENKQYFVDDQDVIWFHGVLLCNELGFKNPSRDIQLHTDEDERQQVPLNGRLVWFVSEPGAWGMVLAAKNRGAIDFKRKLKHEILPQIRQKGFYATDKLREQLRLTVRSMIAYHRYAESLTPVHSDKKGIPTNAKNYRAVDELSSDFYAETIKMAELMDMQDDPEVKEMVAARQAFLLETGRIDRDP